MSDNKPNNSVCFHKIFYDKSSDLKCHRFVCILKTTDGRFKRTVVFTHESYIPELFKKAMVAS